MNAFCCHQAGIPVSTLNRPTCDFGCYILIKELLLIIDRVAYYNCYPCGSAWKTAFEFLGSITSDAEEKKYDLQNDDIHAIVACYKTKEPHKF